MKSIWDWIKVHILGISIAAAAVTGTVIVVSKPTDPITKTTLLGCNGGLTYSPATYSDTFFLKAVDSLGQTMTRYPGGTIANRFNPFTDSAKPSLKDVQILVNKTHCKISFVLNVIMRTLEQNIAWLDSAHKLGIFKDTLYIEDGNETNGPTSEAILKYKTTETFASEMLRWNTAIKNKFPGLTIHFGISGGNKGNRFTSTWNAKVLAKMPDVNFVWHYHNPRQYVRNGIVDTALISYLIDSTYKASFGTFPMSRIEITEFNLRNEDLKNDIVIFKDDYQHGLACSFMMKKFYNMGAFEVLFHNVEGADGNGAVIASKHDSYLSPTGKAIREFIKTTK